jgi:hypothetical protein
MKTTELTTKQKRQRIALLVLPLIIFCCTTLLFWALGGGQPESAKAAGKKGLSMKLPASIIGAEQTGDKMSFYDKAQADSLKKDQLRKTDPYTKTVIDSTANRLSFTDPYSPPPIPAFENGGTNHSAATNEARINQRLNYSQWLMPRRHP